MIDHDLATALDHLAEQVARMRPLSSRNPHAFHEDRSELASRARALALRARTGLPIGAADAPAPVGPLPSFHRHVDNRRICGRFVIVETLSRVR